MFIPAKFLQILRQYSFHGWCQKWKKHYRRRFWEGRCLTVSYQILECNLGCLMFLIVSLLVRTNVMFMWSLWVKVGCVILGKTPSTHGFYVGDFVWLCLFLVWFGFFTILTYFNVEKLLLQTIRNWFSAETMEVSVMLHYPVSSEFLLFEVC